MTDIGELVVRIKADAAQLEREMQKANGTVKKSADEMGGAVGKLKEQFKELIPVITLAAVVEFGKSAFEAADHINDLALRTGFAGSTLSALNIPLKQSGSSLDEFSASMNRMNNLIGEAAKGTNQEAVKAFDALGLSVKRLMVLSPEQQFYAIAEALAKIDNQGVQTNAGMAIFGRSFASLLPLIKESGGNLEKFVEQTKALGGAVTDEQLKRIDELGDRWTAVLEKMKMAALEVVPIIEKIASAADWINKQHPLTALAATGIEIGAKSGWIDRDVADAAIDEASDRTSGRSSSPLKVTVRSKSAAGSNAGLLRPKTSELSEYMANLQAETKAIGLSEKALMMQRVQIEAASKAKADYDNHLRGSKELTDAERQNINNLASAYYDLSKAQKDAERQARQMQETLASSLADMATNWKNAGQSITQTIQSIANEIIKSRITTPLSQALIGTPSAPGLFDGLFSMLPHFAAGGNISAGTPSVVGENGPELFIPNTSGTIVPNGASMGGVKVYQTIHLSPGLPETVNAAIMNAAPQIASMAMAGTMQALQKGGSESRIVGKRS